jgi:peptidoglycan hydrolase-like protein with peptidoglycan-binding domain
MKATSITGYYGPITDQAFKKYKQEAALAATQKPLCPVGFICTSLTNSISTSTGSSAPSVSVFTKKLMVGMSDPQVKALQQALNSLGFTVALAGVGSPGHESEYFGSLTKAAVIRFQNAHADQILKPVGLTRGTGTFEGITITVLNDLMRRQ